MSLDTIIRQAALLQSVLSVEMAPRDPVTHRPANNRGGNVAEMSPSGESWWPTSASVSPVAAGVSAGVAGVLEAASSVAVLPVLPVPIPLISQDAPTANAAAGLSVSQPGTEIARSVSLRPSIDVGGVRFRTAQLGREHPHGGTSKWQWQKLVFISGARKIFPVPIATCTMGN